MTFIQMVRQVQMSMPGLSTAMVKSALNRAYSDLALSWEWIGLEQTLNIKTLTPLYSTDCSSTLTTCTFSTSANTATIVTTSATDGALLDKYLPDATRTFDPYDPALLIRHSSDDQPYIVASATRDLTDGTYTYVLTLERSASVAAPTSWELLQTRYSFYPRTPLVRQILSVTGEYALDEITPTELDRLDPYRQQTSNSATRWCKAGTTGDGEQVIEVWPLPSTETLFKIRVRVTPTLLSANTDTPLINSTLICLDAQIQLFSAYMAQDPQAANRIFNAFGTWRTSKQELYNMLILEDISRHSVSRTVRDVMSGSGSGTWSEYTGADITDYP